jgi:transposase-like protein
MSKYKSDYERLETVKAFKVSKQSIRAFAKEKGISRETLRDWVNAFDNIDGSFVRLNKAIHASEDAVILENDDVTVKMLDSEQIYKKSRHFTRFDHSVVVIEYGKLKVTTSLEQALVILEKVHD